jgi:hypothetical protein
LLTQEQIEQRTQMFHTPLLTEQVKKQLNVFGEGLNLNATPDQEALVARINKARFVTTEDELLEFFVLEQDVPIGQVIPTIKLTSSLPRRIHLAKLQADRHAGRTTTQAVAA